ncbi:MAG TPA: UPF0182 family protein [Mycobacteriales bacterium]|nr:UPF0182 family protein [Mycobacteriales bacterium]HVW80690.1 UPF0182 family protein [Mycobacteriales bacterium]
MTFNVPRPQLPPLNRRVQIAVAVVAALVVLVILWAVFASEYTDLLWFRSVGFSSVFSRRLVTEIVLFVLFGAVMALVVAVNIFIAYRLRPKEAPHSAEQQQLDRYRRLIHPFRGWLLAGVALLIGIITGAAASSRWQTWLLWRNGTHFGMKDPQFHKDISYFAFTYPMQRFTLGVLFAVVAVSLVAALVTAYLYGALRLQTPGPKWTPAGRVHISVLLGVFVLLKAFAYWLDRYGLAFSDRGIVTGPSYTDVHAVLPAKTILVFVAIICALLFFANVYTRNWLLPAVAFGLMVISALVIGGAYPALVQQFKVKPSAQTLEAKYISRNIAATQTAYGITPANPTTGSGDVTTEQYAGVSTETPAQQRQAVNQDTQLRVLDPNVVSQTFEQLQQQRSFYAFEKSLDVDRYQLTKTGPPTDVVIGTRNISLSGLPSGQRNWINDHLVYTHGYGVVAAQADSAQPDGSPDFIEKNLPPTGVLGSFEPRIYFGPGSPNYSIVGAPAGSKPRELDYPTDTSAGQQNYTYDGGGGVGIGSFFTKLLYAWKFKDKNILLSSGVNSKSRILYIRDPRQRVAKVAPWLTLDGDPYPVVVDGQILWVVDGYTTSDGFPYSEQESLGSSTRTSLNTVVRSSAAQSNSQINYIRNSVKATVNAFTGQVNLYAWNQASDPDPVLETWEKAFPGVVQPESAIPAALVPHLRYPEDLFNIQRTLIAKYHVTDPLSFYNGTEFWNVAYDPTIDGGQSTVPQPSYYMTMSPDGGTTTPVFSLTSPLVSLTRRNLTAYLSVDAQPGPDYGKFTLLTLPANAGQPGPGQVQNELDSNATISQAHSLLDQGGSNVIKGNLLTIPIAGSMLYVEPWYVQASGGQTFPVLRKFLVYSNGNAGFQPTLQAAIDEAFGVKSASPPASPGTGTSSGPSSGPTSPPSTSHASAALRQAIADAQRDETDAEEALRRGDFAAYGRDQAALKSDLARIAAAAGSGKSP